MLSASNRVGRAQYVRNRSLGMIFTLSLLIAGLQSAAAGQQPFDKAEFAARRAKVFEKIGDSVAIIFANQEHPHAVRYRESPDFFYLTGLEEPGALLILDGKEKNAVVAAAKKPEWKVRSEGPGLRDIKDGASIYGFTAVMPLESIYAAFNFRMRDARKLYVQLSPPDQLQLGRDNPTTTPPGYWPVAFRLVPSYAYTRTTNQPTDDGLKTISTGGGFSVGAFDVLSAGTLGRNASFLFVPAFDSGEWEIESAWVAP